jgi:hypothetical protein
VKPRRKRPHCVVYHREVSRGLPTQSLKDDDLERGGCCVPALRNSKQRLGISLSSPFSCASHQHRFAGPWPAACKDASERLRSKRHRESGSIAAQYRNQTCMPHACAVKALEKGAGEVHRCTVRLVKETKLAWRMCMQL